MLVGHVVLGNKTYSTIWIAANVLQQDGGASQSLHGWLPQEGENTYPPKSEVARVVWISV